MQRTRLTAFFSPRKIDFDDENIYIVRSGREEKIPIGTILLLKRTSIVIDNIWRFWKIQYRSEDGSEKTVRFLPKGSVLFVTPALIAALQKSIKEKNPNADISNTGIIPV